MWPDTFKKADLELKLVRHLLDDNQGLLTSVSKGSPDRVELLAVSALLHSFYTGIENTFKRIAVEIDGSLPTGPKSHAHLLNRMAQPYGSRGPVISEGLFRRLGVYLNFRHVFRHAYSFDLNWDKMSGLVLQARETLSMVDTELRAFFRAGG